MKKKMYIITAVSAAVAVVFYCFYKVDWCLSLAIVASTTFYHFAMRLAVGYFVSYVVRPKCDYRNAWMRQHRWENKAYKLLGVHAWKSKFPAFSPEKFDLKNGLDNVIAATCEAEIVHTVIIFLSYLPLVVACIWGEPTDIIIFAITSVFAGLIDLIFVIIQRYNRPRLVRIMELSLRRTEKAPVSRQEL